jgi:hypothetical protein
MFFTVLALPVVLTQILILLIVIAIESAVYHKFLKLNPKISVQSVATINLLSALVGWFIFFILEEGISHSQREFLISCIFFNKCQFSGFISFILNLAIFVISFLLKILLFKVFMVLWIGERKLLINTPLPEKLYLQLKNRVKIISDAVLIVFLAHFFSYYAMDIALIIQRSAL